MTSPNTVHPFEARPNSSRREFLRLLAAGAAAGSMARWTPLLRAAETNAGPIVDEYWLQPRPDYGRRRQGLLEYCAEAPTGGGRTGCWSQIARLELGRPIDEQSFHAAIDYVYSNEDCNDFTAAGLLRILCRYPRHAALPASLREAIETCLLKFKYWWDEPGTDERTYHTENHQIIYHSDQLLAGQLFPDRVFPGSGRTGREHTAAALPRLRRWLDWRIRFGFSEWLSHCYFEHDLMALVNLRDFAAQPDIRARAEMLIDVLLFEMALHSHHGVMGSTHGRTYSEMLKSARRENTSPISKLMFGMGTFTQDNMAALALATSSYRCPAPVEAVATDLDRTILCRERHSLNVESAAQFGLSCEREEDVTLFWSVQDYVNPLILDASERISRTRHVRNFALDPSNRDSYEHWRGEYRQQIAAHGRIVDPWQDEHALGEVHIQTLRTPSAMLSCAQDYRPGKPGYQQHIWQATLGTEAVVFTNHPGSTKEGARPDFWAGNGILPRAAQHRNVLVCIHHVPADDPLPFSHAYFPRAAFDEVLGRAPWIFARKGDGHLALYSQHPATWHADANGAVVELRAATADNVWICEIGSRADGRDFSQFVQSISAARVQCDGLGARFQSASVGDVGFGWEEPLVVAGAPVSLHNYPRFDNPYCQAPFLARRLEIQQGVRRLTLDFDKTKRQERRA